MVRSLFVTFFLLSFYVTGYSQEASAPIPNIITPVKKAEEAPLTLKNEDNQKLQLLVAKRSLLEAQAKLLQSDFKAQLDKMTADYQKLTNDLSVAIDLVFASMGVDKATHDINLETGQVIPRSETK